MTPKFFFGREKKNYPVEKEEKKEKNSNRLISRRKFIKALLEMFLLGGTFVVIDNPEKSRKLASRLLKNLRGFLEMAESKYNSTLEQKKIEEEDTRTINEVFGLAEREKEIKIDLEVIKKTQEEWEKKYQDNPYLRESLRRSLTRMEKWRPQLEKIFSREGVPKEFIYLAVAESHWHLNAVSSKGAVGPYQFIAKTARRYGLKIDRRVDERKDPLKSGQACARYLKDLYEKTGDWDLALAGYNGGFIWEYLEECKKESKKPSYSDFLKFLEKKVEDLRGLIIEKGIYIHKVKKGETLFRIARYCGLKVEKLKEINHLKGNTIYPGQEIFCLIRDQERRREIFLDLTRGFQENLNYPAKFKAVVSIIKKERKSILSENLAKRNR